MKIAPGIEMLFCITNIRLQDYSYINKLTLTGSLVLL